LVWVNPLDRKDLLMAGTVTPDDSGLSFLVDDRRYRILSPVRLDGKGQLPLILALYQG
jgi:hypothetical protein